MLVHIICSYNPQKSTITKHLDTLGKNLDFYSTNHEKYVLLGDYNSAEPSQNTMMNFAKCIN